MGGIRLLGVTKGAFLLLAPDVVSETGINCGQVFAKQLPSMCPPSWAHPHIVNR